MRVVIVGAGICGLVAGRQLVESGAEVLLVDKGRSPGGRLATRRIGSATLDHGAQFFTVRTPALQRRVDDWIERGLVAVWTRGFLSDDGHPRYVATAGMNSLAKDLARDLDVRCSTMAFSIRPPASPATTSAWEVVIDDGTTHLADAVIVTTPLPQAFALLADSGLELDESLMRTDYDRTIALLATVDRPAAIPAPGGVQGPTAELSFVADNMAKGISATPAITVHASAAWSEAHCDVDRARRAVARRGRDRRGPRQEVAIRHTAVGVARSVLGRCERHRRAGGRRLRRAAGGSRPQLGPRSGSRPRPLNPRTVTRRRHRRSAPR
jgi:renalase